MRGLSVIVFCCGCLSVLAQKSKNPEYNYTLKWSPGHVVFNSGDTIKCHVRYNISASHSTLQIKNGEHSLTITPNEVKGFSFYDSSNIRVRSFVSCRVERQTNEVFLENIFATARVGLLNHRTYGIPYEYMELTRFISKPTKINRKYLVDFTNGELVPASKENLLRILQPKRPELDAYIAQHHLKFKKVADYVSLLKYHNSL